MAGSIDPLTGAGFVWRLENDPLYRGQVAPSPSGDGTPSTMSMVLRRWWVRSRPVNTHTRLPRPTVPSSYVPGLPVQHRRIDPGVPLHRSGRNVDHQRPDTGQRSHPGLRTKLGIVDRPQGDRVVLFHWTEDTTSQTIQVAMLYPTIPGPPGPRVRRAVFGNPSMTATWPRVESGPPTGTAR